MVLEYFSPVSNITPFTYRDGETYLEQLKRLRNWIDEVSEAANGQVDDLAHQFDAGMKVATDAATVATESAATAESLANLMVTAQDSTVAHLIAEGASTLAALQNRFINGLTEGAPELEALRNKFMDVNALDEGSATLDSLKGRFIQSDVANDKKIYQGVNGYNPDGSDIKNIPGPVSAKFSTGGKYNDNGDGNLFHLASYVQNTGTRPTVALFGMARGAHSFGANLVAYTDTADDAAIGVEIDYGNVGTKSALLNGNHTFPTATINVDSTAGFAPKGNLVIGGQFFRYTGITPTSFTGVTGGGGTIASGTTVKGGVGGTATGVVIVAEGGNIGGTAPGPYIQLQANINSEAATGIKFNGSNRPAVATDGTLIQAAKENATFGIDFAGSKFATAGGRFPLNTGATTAGQALILTAEGGLANDGSFLDIRAGSAGSTGKYGVMFRVSGGNQPVSDTLIKIGPSISAPYGLDLSGGTFTTAAISMGNNDIATGTATGTKIGTATNHKLGFFGATPVVQPSGTPAAATDAATTQTLVNNIRTKLISLGLIA